MKKNLLHLLSFATMIIILASCGKKAPNEAKYIPKDATMVIAVDSKSLNDKMNKGNIPLDTFISRLQKNADTVSAKNKQYWEDFKNSGVSLDNNLYFFMLQKGSIQKGQSNIISLMATLKDQAKFEAYLKKYTAEFSAGNIVEFLLLNPQHPHSILFSVLQLESSIAALPDMSARGQRGRVERLAGRLVATLNYSSVEEILSGGLHLALDNVIRQCAQLHTAIHLAYVDYPIETSLPAYCITPSSTKPASAMTLQ